MPRHGITPAMRRHGSGCRAAVVILLSGLPVCAPTGAALAEDVAVALPVSGQSLAAHIAEASQRFGIPADWIRAVLAAESAYAVHAVSSAGAMGLMQVMPDTWSELRARHALGNDPFEPRDNIFAGTAYLREMLDRYGTIAGMLAAYNAGPGRYDAYLASGRPLPAETRDYVARLAPVLAGAPTAASTLASRQQTSDWRQAPLFVVRAGGGSPAGALPPSGQLASPAAAPGHGIFVARPAAGLRR